MWQTVNSMTWKLIWIDLGREIGPHFDANLEPPSTNATIDSRVKTSSGFLALFLYFGDNVLIGRARAHHEIFGHQKVDRYI